MLWKQTVLSIACLLIFGCSLQARGPAAPREDRSWKHYANTRAGYCIEYPRRWQRGEAFDGTGLYAAATSKHSTLPIGAMDVGAFPDGPSITTVGLNSDLEAHLDGLRKFVHAKDTEILEERALSVAGSDALFLKARYFEPLERSKWVEEVVFTRRNGVLYRLELQTRAEFVSRFEPVFAHFVQSLDFACR